MNLTNLRPMDTHEGFKGFELTRNGGYSNKLEFGRKSTLNKKLERGS